MVIGAKLTGTPGLTVPRYRFPGPVDVYHFSAAITAISDSTDVQLSDQIAPVNRPLYFVANVQVIQAYANGDGAAPIITLKGSLTGSVAVTAAGDAAGTFTRYQGVLAPNEKLLFTPTAGTGTTETGTARVSVTIMDPGPDPNK
jgi:hypothetical protein